MDREVEFEKAFEPIKSGNVPATYALTGAVGFRPGTSIEDELRKFAEWYVSIIGRNNFGTERSRIHTFTKG